MAENNQDFLKKALPFLGLAEILATKGRSPGTFALTQQKLISEGEQQRRDIEKEFRADQFRQQQQAMQNKLFGFKAQAAKMSAEKHQQGLDAIKRRMGIESSLEKERERERGNLQLYKDAGIVKGLAQESDFNRAPLKFINDFVKNEAKLQRHVQGQKTLGSMLSAARGKTTTTEEAKQDVKQNRLKKSVRNFVHVDENLFVEDNEVKDFKKANFAVAKIRPKLDHLIKTIEEQGNQIFGAKADLLEGALRDIQLDIKGPEFAKLGVLAGPDMTILDAVTGDPSSFKNKFLTDISDINPALEKLKRMRATLRRNVLLQGEQLGFLPNFSSLEALERADLPPGIPVIVAGEEFTTQIDRDPLIINKPTAKDILNSIAPPENPGGR